MKSIKDKIINILFKLLMRERPQDFLLAAAAGSFGDTLSDEEILQELEMMFKPETQCPLGFKKDDIVTMCVNKCKNCKELRNKKREFNG